MSTIRKNYIRLASKMRVITIATSSEKAAWTAPVYYVFSNKCFYFFSNPDSKHIKDSQHQQSSENQMAASVFYDDTDFEKIKGLQMQGKIEKVENKRDALLRAKDYIKKFKIRHYNENILEFFHSKYKARLYRFIPEIVYYMDNSQEFGKREKLEL